MAVKNDLNFRISSGLKTIIGKELITDDFIAVFELVKNSFDAHAKRVDITFENLSSPADARIIIKDDGKGMDRRDLLDKWLFVAYSAKRDGTEDYRDKIRSKRIHAGAKGIGRFSCDKLGSHLKIFTKKKTEKQTHCLEVDWNTFEENLKTEFVSIPVTHWNETTTDYALTSGTVLEISHLREDWNRNKLLKLKSSLEKLINPNQENDTKKFSIYIHATDELETDKETSPDEPWKIVNGKVRNLLFETLEVKTTQITSTINEQGSELSTQLIDRGTLIYEIKEAYDGTLKDISIHLFFLNRSAKVTFGKIMGVQPVQYGSVFLYKNGFRIHPFGEANEDSLGLDRRKAQGTRRFLGTRELLGRIEINGPNDDFKESSSRDGGLIKNKSYEDLVSFFYETLKRLEKYVVGVLQFGSDETLIQDKGQNAADEILDIIAKLTKSDKILQVHYDPNLLNILESHSQDSITAIVKNFSRLAAESQDPLLEKEAKKAEKKLLLMIKATEEAEKARKKARREAEQAEAAAKKAEEEKLLAEQQAEAAKEELQEKISQNLFFKSSLGLDVERVMSMHHHIRISTSAIETFTKILSRKIQKGTEITNDQLLEYLKKISFQAKQINIITRFATKANFKLDSADVTNDLSLHIQEYVLNICSGIFFTNETNEPITFELSPLNPLDFVIQYKPIEISIIFDNLFNNAAKHGASTITVSCELTDDGKVLQVRVENNGAPISKKRFKEIFDMGVTTTNGSGLGLYHAREILQEYNGTIHATEGRSEGAEFIIRIPKQ